MIQIVAAFVYMYVKPGPDKITTWANRKYMNVIAFSVYSLLLLMLSLILFPKAARTKQYASY